MKKLSMLLPIFILILAMSASAAASTPVPAVGKVHIPKGTKVMIISVETGDPIGMVEAYEDQDLYLNHTLKINGAVRGWFAGWNENFIANCPEHGREVIPLYDFIIVITKKSVDAGVVEVTLFTAPIL